MKKTPCMSCPRRYPGCHDSCPEYAAYRAGLEVIHEAKAQEFGPAAEYRRERHMRSLKKMWRHGEL